MTMPKFSGGLGFHDIELFNLALLAQQAWRVLQDPGSLSARILKSVYFPNRNFLEASEGTRTSRIWRAIMEGKDVLSHGIIRRIGTGESTEIWNMNWLPRDGLLRPMASSKPNPPSLVCELINQTAACWDQQKLEEFFNPMDVEAISGIPLSTRRQDDFWAWHYEKKGVFSVRSAYRMLVSNRERTAAWRDGRPGKSDVKSEEKEWTSLWQVQVPSNIKMFLWRLARQLIPFGDVLHHRKMAASSSCAIGGMEDSWRHSLLECNLAKCVWALEKEDITEFIGCL